MDNQIITSILDSDTYKFSMQQCVFHQYPEAQVNYEFRCRNKDVQLGFLADGIREQVDAMKNLYLTPEERNYLLLSCPFLTSDYLDYLAEYRFDPGQVNVDKWNGNLLIGIEGKWVDNILWEVPILAIVNELYFRHLTTLNDNRAECCEIGMDRLNAKIEMLKPDPNFKFAEFGTRRRFSKEWQRVVVKNLVEKCPNIIGTSNVALAMEFGIKPIGTVAHEWFSAHLALVDRIETAQKRAMCVWQQEYGTDLGIILSDTFTVDAFLRDFDVVLANTYQGVRQDSGNAIIFGEKMIAHYKKLGIEPKIKTIVFSDGLDMPTAINIFKEFVGRIGISFGIGTNLSNDCSLKPLNIVIKAITCNNRHVVKLSDNPAKAIGDPEMIEKVKKAYRVG